MENENLAQAPELTFGEKAVGKTFNPGGSPEVNDINDLFARTIDRLNHLRETTDNQENKRMYSIAITEAQTAQMWAVKAATWK
jgi:hypothetical protein